LSGTKNHIVKRIYTFLLLCSSCIHSHELVFTAPIFYLSINCTEKCRFFTVKWKSRDFITEWVFLDQSS